MDEPVRLCADCAADISERHGNSKRCLPCSLVHDERLLKAKQERQRERRKARV